MHLGNFFSANRQIKEDFNELQMQFKCCGNDNYADWHSVHWMERQRYHQLLRVSSFMIAHWFKTNWN